MVAKASGLCCSAGALRPSLAADPDRRMAGGNTSLAADQSYRMVSGNTGLAADLDHRMVRGDGSVAGAGKKRVEGGGSRKPKEFRRFRLHGSSEDDRIESSGAG